GIDARSATRMELEHGEAERLSEWEVLAFGICDRDPPAEHPDRAVDEALDRSALAHADVTGDDHVRVGEDAIRVGGERGVGESAPPREHVGPDVDAASPQTCLSEKRVRRADMRRRSPVARYAQSTRRARARAHANRLRVG